MFNEIIVAIYEEDAEAEQAVADLVAAHVPASSVVRHSKDDSPSLGSTATPHPEGNRHGFWSRLFGGHSSDHAVYDHALHNGGNVVMVTTVPDQDMHRVMAILERHNPIDVDERAASFTGIAHNPDPAVRGTDELADAGSLVNQGGPRIRRFAVVSRA